MKYFNNCKTKEEARKLYCVLAKQYHPDITGNDDAREIIQMINDEYEFFCAKKMKEDNFTSEETEIWMQYDGAYRILIEKLIIIPAINIEIVGTWVWVTGETKPASKSLSAAGMHYCSKKIAWSWHPPHIKSRRASKKSLDDIRAKYGSEEVKATFKGKRTLQN